MRVPHPAEIAARLIPQNAEFPDSSRRSEQYRVATAIIADALTRSGYEVTDYCREQWGGFFARLPDADTAAEHDPYCFDTPDDALAFVELPLTEDNRDAARVLLDASRGALQAIDVEEHLDYRRTEALATTELLRLQSDRLVNERELWNELGEISVGGIYFDTALDAEQDAAVLKDIEAGDLRHVATQRLLHVIRDADKRLLFEFTRAGIESGMAGYLLSSERAGAVAKRALQSVIKRR